MSKKFVGRHQVLCNELKSPISVTTAEGGKTSSTHRTLPHQIKVGSFQGKSSFTVMDLGRYDVILGLSFINRYGWMIQGGQPPRVFASSNRGEIEIPIHSYQDPTNRLPVGVVLCHSLAEFEEEMDEGDQIYVVIPRKDMRG